jgi:uncharacterized membrane protein YjgN (DUF898 family)
MDMRVDAAPQAPAIRHQLRFEGSGGEYFKIWIVNLALTIVTLGIFSAWAKVRSKRYFYGNTYIGEHNFDYHGQPLRILLGRLIALALLLAYSATVQFLPKATFVWGFAFLFGMPWLVVAGLRFNAKNSSYRNIRFNFTGTYGGAFAAYILWAFLAALTLFTTYPLARRARDQYNINNHSFGGKYFTVEIPGAAMYRIYLMALLFFVGFLALASGIYFGIKTAPLDFHNPIASAPFFLVFGGAYLFALLFLTTYVGTRVFNLVLGRTVLADQFRFEASLSPLHMTWLMFSNLVLTLLTLGLFYPWAMTRIAQYRAKNLVITGPGEMDGFISELVGGRGAIGEEVASFFDVDLGL